ncbi:MAG: TRAP transporter small permease [Succinivibrio sp.]|nr:TRAP transporter small permease [Succinivibrio sp.]
METFRGFFTRLQLWSRRLIGVCMMVMMTVIFVQTATRYLVFYSIPWSEELSRYLYVALTLIGLNLAITSKQLVRIDIIDAHLGPSAEKWLNAFRNGAALVITAVFFYSSFGMISGSAYQTSPAMGISMQIMYSVLGAGFLLSAVAQLFEFIDALKAPAKKPEDK